MKILHTSDWHLGRTFCGKKRTREFTAFFEWLLSVLDERKVDVLIVAGDIFDTTTPSTLSQQLYYQFLCRAASVENSRRHVVIVGGNHDSPSFLDAPKELLRFLDVHVVGAAPGKMEDELLTIRGANGEPELLVCAVPYLRDRDVRSLELNAESLQDKDRKLLEGIERHYREAGRMAEEARASLGGDIPVVGTGHLFAAGGQIAEGDGVRDLYVGSLARVGAELFPSCFDYVALGHLHSPQKVGGSEFVRYSGAPFPMSAREAARGRKSVVLVEFGADEPSVEELPVPIFQEFAYVSGDMAALSRQLEELRQRNDEIWAEVFYEGQRLPYLREKVMEMVAGTKVEILKIRDASAEARALGLNGMAFAENNLTDIGELNESDVFMRCMEKRTVPEEDRPELLDTYRQVLASVYEENTEI